jgi:hypothetical protein
MKKQLSIEQIIQNTTITWQHSDIMNNIKKEATNKRRREAARIAAHHMTGMWLAN